MIIIKALALVVAEVGVALFITWVLSNLYFHWIRK